MNAQQRAAVRSFRRVQEFLASLPVAETPINLGKPVAALGEVLASLSQQAVDQEAGDRLTQGETKRQRALREELWSKHMLPVAQIAREELVPGMDKELRMPRKRADNDALVAASEAMAEAAAKHEAVFVENGRPADFLPRLREATKALADAIGARVITARRRLTATKGLEEQLKRGRSAVRKLNANLKPVLSSHPELLAAWDNARRAQSVTGGSIGTAEEGEPTIAKVA